MHIEKLLRYEPIHGLEMPTGTIIITLDNNYQIACNNFRNKRTCPLKVYIYNPDAKKWIYTSLKNEYTDMMWQYHKEHKKKNRKCKGSISYKKLMKIA